jgi:hypothetical protein
MTHMFVDSPTELTTAFTDVILAMQALLAVVMLRRSSVRKHMWTGLWAWFFGLLCVSSMLGAIAHGIKMTETTQNGIWTIVYLALGVLMALFAITAISMMWGSRAALRCLPVGLLIAVIFFGVTQFWSDSFLLFVVYEAISMILALVLYAAGFWLRREPGSHYLAFGIIVGLIAAGVESQSHLRFSVAGYHIDNHGIFHLVQMISLALLTIGVYQSHFERKLEHSSHAMN